MATGGFVAGIIGQPKEMAHTEIHAAEEALLVANMALYMEPWRTDLQSAVDEAEEALKKAKSDAGVDDSPRFDLASRMVAEADDVYRPALDPNLCGVPAEETPPEPCPPPCVPDPSKPSVDWTTSPNEEPFFK